MRRGDIGLDDERPLVTLGGRRLLWATQYMTRGELMDLLPQRQEEGTEETEPTEGEEPAPPELALARAVALKPLREGLRLAGYVTRVDDGAKKA